MRDINAYFDEDRRFEREDYELNEGKGYKKGDIVGDCRIIEIRKYVLGHTYLWQKIKKQPSTNTAGG